jgi:hypothetical protein
VGDPVDALPFVVGHAAAGAGGYDERRARRLAARGHWTRLRRGYFATAAELEEDLRWRSEVVAVVAAHRRDLVLSFAHAARAWRLPSPLGGWGDLTFTCASGPTRRRAGVHVAVAPLDDDEIRLIGSVAVTSPARTVGDCARTLPGPDALAIADRALRAGLVTYAELRGALERMKGWPGAVQARRVVEQAEGRRETPLESWSAWSFDEQGVPAPEWQVVLCDHEGVFLARPDAWWRHGIAGEADGRLKYRLAALERGGVRAESLVAVLDDERRRELQLRRAGAVVVRWGAADVRTPGRARALAEHLREEIGRATVASFRGTVVSA